MCGILAVLHAQAEGNAVAAELQYALLSPPSYRQKCLAYVSSVRLCISCNTAAKMLVASLPAPLKAKSINVKETA